MGVPFSCPPIYPLPATSPTSTSDESTPEFNGVIINVIVFGLVNYGFNASSFFNGGIIACGGSLSA